VGVAGVEGEPWPDGALHAADALQLAAAVAAADDSAAQLPFVTLDTRLALAAQREGFEVIQPAAS